MLINRMPMLYLGRCKVTGAYYFLSSKEGEGRFLKYLKYPYWCLASQLGNLLDLTAELPESVMEEVISFIQGKTRYEIVPKKQGRAERIVRHEISEQEETRPEPREASGLAPSEPKTAVAPAGTGPAAGPAEAPRRRGRPRKDAAQAGAPVAGSGRPADVRPGPAAEGKHGGRRLTAGSDVLGQSGSGSERRGGAPEPVVEAAEKPKRKRRMSADQ